MNKFVEMYLFRIALLLILVIYRVSGGIPAPTTVGKFKLSPIGCGTWAWGNRFLWGNNHISMIPI